MNDATSGACHGTTRGPWMTPDRARKLAVAAGGLQSAAEELLDTADELIRAAARWADVYSVPWGVCPEHGAPLRSTAGRCWCTAPGCLRRWFLDRLAEPCAEPVTHRVIDAEGQRLDLCDGHAIDARTRIIGATVSPLS